MEKFCKLSDKDIEAALHKADFKKSEAARILGITPQALYSTLVRRPTLLYLVEQSRLAEVIKTEEVMYALRDDKHFLASKFILTRKGLLEGWGESPIEVKVVDSTADVMEIIRLRHEAADKAKAEAVKVEDADT